MAKRSTELIGLRSQGFKHTTEALNKRIPLALRIGVMRRVLHVSARPMVRFARSEYKRLDGSGSLALSTRSWNVRKGSTGSINAKGKTRRTGANAKYVAVIHMGPKRDNTRALRMWARHYGRTRLNVNEVRRGIYHGLYTEYGTKRDQPAFRVLTKTARARGRLAANKFGFIMNRSLDKYVDRIGRSQKFRRSLRR